jgi:fumarylacetoacetate (FAA) hydrolase
LKLGSLKRGGRDGTLVVVSDDIRRVLSVPQIAPTLQRALEDWDRCSEALHIVAERLNTDPTTGVDMVPRDMHSPLPRAYQWCDGSVYLSHLERLRKARGAELPPNLYHDPVMYQGGSDSFVGPSDPILLADAEWGIDLEAEIVVITDDVPMGISEAAAERHIKLIMLANDVSLRNLLPNEISKGLGLIQSKPATAFTPVAITPDSLAPSWSDCRLSCQVRSWINDKLLGSPNAAIDSYFNFAQLIAYAARTRELEAGTVIGAGTVSNRDISIGVSCLAERRAMEISEFGSPRTPFLQFGDLVCIEGVDGSGQSIFGKIEQRVQQYKPAAR